MINRGNVFLGYSLALVTTVTIKKNQNASKNVVRRAIMACVQEHINRCFNKLRYAWQRDDFLARKYDKGAMRKKSADIRRIVNDLVPIVPLPKVVPQTSVLQSICSRKSDAISRHGKIYILFRIQKHDKRPDYSDSVVREKADGVEAKLVSMLESIIPEVRVEFFAVTYDTDKKKQADCLYHLASRVCGAMAEYKSHLHRTPSLQNRHKRKKTGKPAISECAIEALPLIKKDGRISKPVKSSEVVRQILDLRDATDLVCEGLDGSMNFFPPVPREMQGIFQGEDNKKKAVAARYKFPFGVWFRGQSRVCGNLTPSLYHEKDWVPVHESCRKVKCDGTMYDESTLVHHFMANRAQMRHDYADTFECLCLMQHYDAPSRVLDWTEDILTALYFAVADTTDDCDGAVWVLNAGRLNEITRVSSSKRYVCLATSTDVILRSTMALARTGTELHRMLLQAGKLEEVKAVVKDRTFWRWMEGDPNARPSKTLEKLACPVAVFPTRVNDRERMQLAAFTVYGGKDYDAEVKQIRKWERFPSPKSLLWVSQHLRRGSDKNSWNKKKKKWIPKGKPFLDMYVVPNCAKRKLREQLKRVGVHVGSLFPELEYQAKYIRHQWRFEYEPPRRSKQQRE